MKGPLSRVTSVAVFACSAALSLSKASAQTSPLPKPSGQYAVGRTLFDWTDDSRPAPDSLTRHRELAVWVWYPATSQRNRKAAEWMPGGWGVEFRGDYGKTPPPAMVDSLIKLARAPTHAYVDARAATRKGGFPVLLFGAGLGVSPLDYAGMIEDVASHGYIVVGVVSPDLSRASVYSDGHVVRGRDPVELATRGGARRTTSLVVRAYGEAVLTYSSDLSFALTQLANTRGLLRGSMNMTRVGAFGHSLGGTAALQCAHDDARVRAVFDIDGTPVFRAGDHAFRKPLLVLSAASTRASYDGVLGTAMPGLHLRLSRTTHAFSSDGRIMTARPQNPQSADLLPSQRALHITTVLVDAFFTQYLGGRPQRVLSGPSVGYPEITFESPRREKPPL